MSNYEWLFGVPEAMWTTWNLKIPGTFRDDVAFLDIETVKVPTAPGFRIKTGEPLSRRWSAFLVGVARAGRVVLVERDGDDEVGLLRGVREAIGPAGEVVYSAGRERFDEFVLKGRYTYARRGLEDVAFFPALPGADDLRWTNRPAPADDEWRSLREANKELPSKDVPDAWFKSRWTETVMIHLLRDLAWMMGKWGDPDPECEAWCRRVLTDYVYAWEQVFGPED